jgi:beta-lactamase regulating signal transducer with metallopeptidase domain
MRLGIDGPVELLQSDEVLVPVALGWRRPAVLLPTGLTGGLASFSLVPLLAHELAHVRARDYAANVV